MQISLRPQMVAGVAALGATAIAIAPIAQPSLIASGREAGTHATTVALAGFDSSIAAVIEVIQDVSTNVLYNGDWTAPWTTIPDLDYAYLGYQGILPDIAYWPLPLAQTVVTNVSGYAWAGLRGVGDLVDKSLQAVWNTPGALVSAVQYLIAGQPDLALAEIAAQILLPLRKGVNSAINSVAYIVDNLAENVGIVLGAIPELVGNLAGVTLAGTSFVVSKALTTLTTSLTQLTFGDVEGAWNTAVAGFLGRNGTLGYLEQLTIGPGVVTGDPTTPVIPSLRAVATQGTRQLADGFYNFPYDPSAGPLQPTQATPLVEPAAAGDDLSVRASLVEAAPDDTAGAKPADPGAPKADPAGAGDSERRNGDTTASAQSGPADTGDATGHPAKRHGLGGSKKTAKAHAGSAG